MARGYRGPRDTPTLPLRVGKPDSSPHPTMVPSVQQGRSNSAKRVGTYRGDPGEKKEHPGGGTMANRSWGPCTVPRRKGDRQGGYEWLPPIPAARGMVRVTMK